jgi:hypothetical protein
MKVALMKIRLSLGKAKICLLITLTLLAWAQTATADYATGLYELALPYFLLVVFIEASYFSLFANVLLKLKIKFRKIFLAIVVANFVTYLLGTLTPFTDKGARGHGLLIITIFALVISAFIEWIVYLPFFEKGTIGRWNLLRISFVGNAFTHALIAQILRFNFFG